MEIFSEEALETHRIERPKKKRGRRKKPVLPPEEVNKVYAHFLLLLFFQIFYEMLLKEAKHEALTKVYENVKPQDIMAASHFRECTSWRLSYERRLQEC